MSSSHPHTEDTCQSSSVAHNSLVNMGKVASYSSEHTNMLSNCGKLDGDTIDVERGKQLGVLNIVCVQVRENKQFCFSC